MIATCIEQNDNKSHVLHEVRNTIDGREYRIVFSTECPMTAIKIAYEVPLTYWEEIGND
jgi:hypothetical protein